MNAPKNTAVQHGKFTATTAAPATRVKVETSAPAAAPEKPKASAAPAAK